MLERVAEAVESHKGQVRGCSGSMKAVQGSGGLYQGVVEGCTGLFRIARMFVVAYDGDTVGQDSLCPRKS